MVKKKLLDSDSFWRGKKVLITGHTGFKGSWLTLFLMRRGAEVFGFSLPLLGQCLYSELELKKRDLVGNVHDNFGDISKKDEFQKFLINLNPDIVFHLAAQSLVRKSYLEPFQTWNVNLMGSINLLDGLKKINKKCACLLVTTDKVYKNVNHIYPYREIDDLGGKDPYSASKAAVELAVESWRMSYCGHGKFQTKNLGISTARAGNVIGGGDWSEDRIIPDAIRSLKSGNDLVLRNPLSIRPWQHVLEPLSGYILLAKKMYNNLPFDDNKNKSIFSAFNFGPSLDSNRSVQELIEKSYHYWKGKWQKNISIHNFHEEKILKLASEKAYENLGWEQIWNFEETIQKTILWYKSVHEGKSQYECCLKDIENFESRSTHGM